MLVKAIWGDDGEGHKGGEWVGKLRVYVVSLRRSTRRLGEGDVTAESKCDGVCSDIGTTLVPGVSLFVRV